MNHPLLQQLMRLSEQARASRRVAIEAGDSELAAYFLDVGFATAACIRKALVAPPALVQP